jgi:hypothetical protein
MECLLDVLFKPKELVMSQNAYWDNNFKKLAQNQAEFIDKISAVMFEGFTDTSVVKAMLVKESKWSRMSSLWSINGITKPKCNAI